MILPDVSSSCLVELLPGVKAMGHCISYFKKITPRNYIHQFTCWHSRWPQNKRERPSVVGLYLFCGVVEQLHTRCDTTTTTTDNKNCILGEPYRIMHIYVKRYIFCPYYGNDAQKRLKLWKFIYQSIPTCVLFSYLLSYFNIIPTWNLRLAYNVWMGLCDFKTFRFIMLIGGGGGDNSSSNSDSTSLRLGLERLFAVTHNSRHAAVPLLMPGKTRKDDLIISCGWITLCWQMSVGIGIRLLSLIIVVVISRSHLKKPLEHGGLEDWWWWWWLVRSNGFNCPNIC